MGMFGPRDPEGEHFTPRTESAEAPKKKPLYRILGLREKAMGIVDDAERENRA